MGVDSKNYRMPDHMPEPARKSSPSSEDELADLPARYLDTLSNLFDTLQDGVDAAIWRRSTPSALSQWLDNILATALPEERFVLKPNVVAACIEDLFKSSGHETSPALAWIARDAAELAATVGDALQTEYIRLRLEAIDNNACSKLHIDNVTARLICTYRGPGTQIGLAESDLDTLHTIPTGMPILLKGKCWPGDTEPQLRHRSPPIKGIGLTRLVLVVEAASLDDAYPGYDTLYPSEERALEA